MAPQGSCFKLHMLLLLYELLMDTYVSSSHGVNFFYFPESCFLASDIIHLQHLGENF